MSEKDFNLSKERRCLREKFCYLEKDIKEFIKRLKEIFEKRRCAIRGVTIHKEIDKLAGDKLK